jgi:hypothetical protein
MIKAVNATAAVRQCRQQACALGFRAIARVSIETLLEPLPTLWHSRKGHPPA